MNESNQHEVRSHKSNTEFVTELMEFSKSGPLTQVFVIEAIRYYSELIVKNGEPKENLMQLISPVAWYKVAVEVDKRLKEAYENKR